jgi:hypothetical protein
LENEDKTQEMSFCGNCGKKLLANATFCAYCGAQIPKVANIAFDHPVKYGYIPHTPSYEPPLRFMDHFKGVILNPKEEFKRLLSRPNFKQPLLLNFTISLLSVIAYIFLLVLGKVTITFTTEFFESIGTTFPSGELDPSELGEIFSNMMIIFIPIVFVIQWLIFSAVLWAVNMISASDLPRSDRTYKKMATVVGWAQFPLILNQIVLIIVAILFLSPGEIIYNSIFEIETIVTGTPPLPLGIFIELLDLTVFFWGVFLVYYAVKSQSSLKANPVLISLIYSFVVFFIRFDWVLSIIISLL